MLEDPPMWLKYRQQFSKDESAKSSSSAMRLFASYRKHLTAVVVAEGGPNSNEVQQGIFFSMNIKYKVYCKTAFCV